MGLAKRKEKYGTGQLLSQTSTSNFYGKESASLREEAKAAIYLSCWIPPVRRIFFKGEGDEQRTAFA